MNIKRLLTGFVTVFAVAFIVTGIVTLLWNVIIHGASTIDWETSLRFAIVFGIIFSWIESRKARRKCNVA
jgi:uncharacterized membrane-anchored protein